MHILFLDHKIVLLLVIIDNYLTKILKLKTKILDIVYVHPSRSSYELHSKKYYCNSLFF